jgi:hypothetical protein
LLLELCKKILPTFSKRLPLCTIGNPLANVLELIQYSLAASLEGNQYPLLKSSPLMHDVQVPLQNLLKVFDYTLRPVPECTG